MIGGEHLMWAWLSASGSLGCWVTPSVSSMAAVVLGVFGAFRIGFAFPPWCLGRCSGVGREGVFRCVGICHAGHGVLPRLTCIKACTCLFK